MSFSKIYFVQQNIIYPYGLLYYFSESIRSLQTNWSCQVGSIFVGATTGILNAGMEIIGLNYLNLGPQSAKIFGPLITFAIMTLINFPHSTLNGITKCSSTLFNMVSKRRSTEIPQPTSANTNRFEYTLQST